MQRAILAAAALLAAGSATATAPPPADTVVKAAFLPKFAPYVSWPPNSLPNPDSPIVLCIVGADPFAGLVDGAAADLKVEQHPLVVRRMEAGTGAASCQIAFLGASARRTDVLRALHGAPVLTVTDARLGPEHGIIHFVLQGSRVRFVIDDAMASTANLAISAKLLSLAASVNPRKHP